MQHFWSLNGVQLNSVWLTIGSFDGVHLGHQAIIRDMVAGAHQAGVPAVVLTFHPNPAIVLRRRQGPYYLTTPEERAALLGDLGVDFVITHPFNREIADLSAHDFMQRLYQHLQMSCLWIGHDFALGRNREGNVSVLQRLGEQFGYKVHIMQPVMLEGQVVSSSQIRVALAEGDMPRAERLLGRPYHLSGTVIHGDGRGRSLGIPTANLDIWAERTIPRSGVYACLASVDGHLWQAVTNVGVRPTFEKKISKPTVETHLLDFDRDLYFNQVALSFFLRLRDEQRFPNVQALVAQIRQDIERARQFLPSTNEMNNVSSV